VGIDFRIRDDAVGADYITGRHWQNPRRIVVDERQVVLEALVDLDQIVRQGKTNAESVRDFGFDVTEDRKAELVVALRPTAIGRGLRRDGDQARAARLDSGQLGLQRLQLHVAVWAPDAAVERQYQRAFGEQVARRYRLAVRIIQGEIRRLVAGLEC